MRPRVFSRAIGALLALILSATPALADADDARFLEWKMVRVLPHDRSHFTQGLVVDEGRFLESVGQYGRSALYEKDIATGRVLRERRNDSSVFAEGVTVLAGRIFQLSWREQRAWIYDRELRLQRELRYDGEGWGLTHDGDELITSDGSPRLSFRDPQTLAPRRAIDVHERGKPLARLNELEFARGSVLANVWLTDRIVVIDPASGKVTGSIDLAVLRRELLPPPDLAAGHVLNGIAHDAASDRFYVTGKCWPALFEIEIAPW